MDSRIFENKNPYTKSLKNYRLFWHHSPISFRFSKEGFLIATIRFLIATVKFLTASTVKFLAWLKLSSKIMPVVRFLQLSRFHLERIQSFIWKESKASTGRNLPINKGFRGYWRALAVPPTPSHILCAPLQLPHHPSHLLRSLFSVLYQPINPTPQIKTTLHLYE